MKQEYKYQGFLRPYKVNGYSLGSIIFYNKGQELFYISSGWLEDNNNDIKSIWIEEPKRANKINLDRTDNFIVVANNPKKDYMREKDIMLYINTELENISISEPKEEFYYEDDSEQTFKQHRIIKGLKHTKKVYNKEIEEFRIEEFSEQTGIKHIFTHTNKLKLYGEKIKKVTELLNSEGVKISKYDIEKILKHYPKIKEIMGV